MSSVRTRTLAAGVALAIAVGVLGLLLGADYQRLALLGASAGAVLALVADRSAVARCGAFLVGVVASAVVYGVGLVALPINQAGKTVTTVAVVLVLTAVAAATAAQLPLWALLLGAAAMIGSYEAVATTENLYGTQAFAALSNMLLAAAGGFLVTTLVRAGATADNDSAADSAHSPALPAPRVTNDAPATSEIGR